MLKHLDVTANVGYAGVNTGEKQSMVSKHSINHYRQSGHAATATALATSGILMVLLSMEQDITVTAAGSTLSNTSITMGGTGATRYL